MFQKWLNSMIDDNIMLNYERLPGNILKITNAFIILCTNYHRTGLKYLTFL